MIYLVFLVSFLALAHFIYEGIIAPSFRMQLRNELFELRDEIRRIKFDGVSEVDKEAFWYTHDGVNNLLDRLSWLTLDAKRKMAKAYKSDPELRELVKSRKSMLEACSDKRITDVFEKTAVVLEKAFLINYGAWMLYLLPIFAVLISLGSLKKLAGSLLLTPDRQREQMLPRPIILA